MTGIIPGTSGFFANRKGKHNWLNNNNRPFLSLITTDTNGQRSYQDLFLNKHDSVKVERVEGRIILSFPENTNQPIFRVIFKGS